MTTQTLERPAIDRLDKEISVKPQMPSREVPMDRTKTPPLVAGDRLSRAEFERRYHAQPKLKKAELIEGIVYMPSPVKYRSHGNPHLYLSTWLGTYLATTPTVDGGDNATLRLDGLNEPQPDLVLRIDQAFGGHSYITPDDYLVGAPELIVEVAASSANYDMHAKRPVYARNGVQEYLLVLTHDQTVHWYALHDGEYEELSPDAEGVLHSEVFPGLWLQPAALWTNDLAIILNVLQQGLASPEHDAFVQNLGNDQ